MSSKMLTEGSEKQRSQRNNHRQANNRHANREGDHMEANFSSTVDSSASANEIMAKVVAVMEEKMTTFSSKLDIITAKLEDDSQCLEEAKSRIIIAYLESRLADAETKLCPH